MINQWQVQCPVVTTSKDTLAYFTLEGKLQDNQSGAPIAYGTVGVVGTSIGSITNQDGEFRLRLPDSLRQGRIGVSGVVSGTSGDSYSRSGDSCCQSYTVVA